MKKPQIIVARITGYDVSNILLGGKTIFIPLERRDAIKAEHPIGEIVRVPVENGTLTDITKAQGSDLEKFLKGEEARRSGKSTTAAEKIRAEVTKKDEAPEPEKTPAGQQPETSTLTVPPNAGVSINPATFNDSIRESPTAKGSQCGCSGPCIKNQCRKFISCWTAEINAMRALGLHNSAGILENNLIEILGG